MPINEDFASKEKLEDITGITCMYVPVKDVYESIQWYQINLGCKTTNHNPVKTGMKQSILRFPDPDGNVQEAGLRCAVPALFLVESQERPGFTNYRGSRFPIGCFITPRIQDMYIRFKENGVNILGEIPDGRELGPNFRFFDPDGNLWEMWQP